MEPMSVEESSAFVSSTISASSMVDNESKIDGFRAVAGTTDEFANDFSKVVANDRLRNLITSPLSVQVLLAMATYGARGATATQMRSALHIPNDDVVGQSGYQSLIERLNIVKGVDLRLASKIYTSNDSPVKPAFKDLTAQRFLSSSQEVDFSDAVGSARTINAWCEEQTNYRIRDLIRPDSLRQGSSLILVNAVYFKGQWTDKFDRALTRDRPFHVDKTTIRKVPTMFMERDMRYGNVPEMNSRLVEIAYQGGEFSMIIILPNDIDGLGRVRDNLHKVNLSQTWLRCSFKKVNLYLPKFKIERTLDLKAALQNLGMTDMFQDHADFSGMSNELLKVSGVLQKAFIEVNEEGTEAAAATYVRFGFTGPKQTEVFKVNRPFYYQIRSIALNVPLFTGFYTAQE